MIFRCWVGRSVWILDLLAPPTLSPVSSKRNGLFLITLKGLLQRVGAVAWKGVSREVRFFGCLFASEPIALGENFR